MNIGDNMFERSIALFGEENFEKIKTKKILLIGLGGVGSYSLEALVRNGFHNITVVDFDKIDITNLNRQLITNTTNIGHSKVIEAILRAKRINPNISIDAMETRLTIDNIEQILNMNYDYIIDACDDIAIKFTLIEKSLKYLKFLLCVFININSVISSADDIIANNVINIFFFILSPPLLYHLLYKKHIVFLLHLVLGYMFLVLLYLLELHYLIQHVFFYLF